MSVGHLRRRTDAVGQSWRKWHVDEQQTDPAPAPLTSEVDEALERGRALTDDRKMVTVSILVEGDNGMPYRRELKAFRDDASSIRQIVESFEIDLTDLIRRARA